MDRKNNPANDSRCAKCGACSVVCPVYAATGRESLTARGKLHLLERLAPAAASAEYAEILSQCLLCGACRAVCPRQADPPAKIIEARQAAKGRPGSHSLQKQLVCSLLSRPALLRRTLALSAAAFALLGCRLPPDSGLRLKLGLLAEAVVAPSAACDSRDAQPGKGPAVLSYFPGCLATHLEPEIGRATAALAARASGSPPEIPAGQACCGQAAYSSGDLDQARNLAKKNITAFSGAPGPILTSCASCYCHLLTYPNLLAEEPLWRDRAEAFAARVVEFSTFFAANLPAAPQPAKKEAVLYHDPCHLRFAPRIIDPPRRLLTIQAGMRLAELPGGPRCCGQGGLFGLAHPDLSRAIREKLLADFNRSPVALVTSTCSGCLLQWREGFALTSSGTRVLHLAMVLARGLPEAA